MTDFDLNPSNEELAEAFAESLTRIAHILADFSASEVAAALLDEVHRSFRLYNQAEARSTVLAKLDGQWTTSVGSFVQSAVTSC